MHILMSTELCKQSKSTGNVSVSVALATNWNKFKMKY